MTQLDKALARLQQRPKDLTWDEAIRIMQGCGFKLTKASGSRRKFFHEEKDIVATIHQPHPGNILKHYQMGILIEALQTSGDLPYEHNT
jgi:predicted RNA binding protein YcfA (HicA-like mRNA interferase family)